MAEFKLRQNAAEKKIVKPDENPRVGRLDGPVVTTASDRISAREYILLPLMISSFCTRSVSIDFFSPKGIFSLPENL